MHGCWRHKVTQLGQLVSTSVAKPAAKHSRRGGAWTAGTTRYSAMSGRCDQLGSGSGGSSAFRFFRARYRSLAAAFAESSVCRTGTAGFGAAGAITAASPPPTLSSGALSAGAGWPPGSRRVPSDAAGLLEASG